MVNKFSTSIQGYKKEEVNDFVKEVTDEYESMLQKLKSSCEIIETLKSELKHYKDIESPLNRAILVAEESTSNIKKAAYDESKVIIEDAKRNATKVINNALQKAEKIESEAESLRRKVAVYKRRFRTLVEDQLDEIEQFDDRLFYHTRTASLFILKFKNDLIYKKEDMIMEEDFNVNNPTKENIDYAFKKRLLFRSLFWFSYKFIYFFHNNIFLHNFFYN